MTPMRPLMRILLGICLATAANAEQMQPIGDYEAHYSLVPTLFLKPDIAARHDIRRGRDRALLNVSVLDAGGTPVRAKVTGYARNLLGQDLPLGFQEVQDGTAVYYLAVVRHTDREVLRFAIEITTPDAAVHRLDLTQTIYWEGR
jgi:hypothetical protein